MQITITDNAYKSKTWERIKAARTAAESAGFLFNGVRYDSDPLSLQRISSAVTLAILAQSAGQPFAIDWTVADNSVVALDAAGMIGVGLACGQYVASVFDRARVLREQIEAATTADELDGLQWAA
jgi:hypothetical protein